MRTTENKIQEKFVPKKITDDLKEESRFEVFAPIGSHVNGKRKKIGKNRKLEISKIQNSTFVRKRQRDIEKKK